MAEIELAGIAEDEIKTEREKHIDRANRQIGAPIRVVENQRQRDDRERREQQSHSPGQQCRARRCHRSQKRWRQTFSSRLSEIRPVGLIASITNRRPKTTISIRPGSRYCVV